MNIGLWIFLGFLWSIIGFIFILILGGCFDARLIAYASGVEFLNPTYIYKQTNVNWFGCAILTLVMNLICPILSVGYWFYKFCTIGRKH